MTARRGARVGLSMEVYNRNARRVALQRLGWWECNADLHLWTSTLGDGERVPQAKAEQIALSDARACVAALAARASRGGGRR